MKPGLSQPGSPAIGCPAGSAALSGPGTVNVATTGDFTSTTTGLCYCLLGKPVTFTSAGVTLYQQSAGSEPFQHSAVYILRITVPAAEAAALTAITTQTYDSQAQIAIIVAGKTWGVPFTEQPLTNGQFAIRAQDRNQALELQRALLPPG